MFYYFYGDDTYGAREAILELAVKQNATIRWLDEEELAQRSVGDWLSQGTNLFGKDLIVIRDPSDLPQDTQSAIIALQREKISSEAVLWDRLKIDKRSQLFRTFKAQGRAFPYLAAPLLVQWLTAKAKEQQGNIDREAALKLIDWIGLDRWRLSAELERLLLVNSAITKEIIEREIVQPERAEIFSTLEAVVKGDQAMAVKNIETLLAQGSSEFYIFSMLAYQFRVLMLVKAGLAENKNQSTISREAKLHPYAVEKSIPFAQRFSEQFLRDALTRIMATDFSIKQGKIDARTGLMMLIIGLMPTKTAV